MHHRVDLLTEQCFKSSAVNIHCSNKFGNNFSIGSKILLENLSLSTSNISLLQGRCQRIVIPRF